jgi:hypothetical protein
LSYEHEQYVEIKSELPERGDWVQTAHGPGEVIAVNVVKENVTVDLGDGNTVDCTAKEIMDVRQRVAAEAQARNAQGITPAAQYGFGTLHHADELLAGDDPHVLHALEDVQDAPPRTARPPAPNPAPVRADTALGESVMHAARPAALGQPRQPQPRSERGRADAGRARQLQAAPQGRAAPASQNMQPETADDAAAQQARRRKRRKRGGK